RQTFDSSLDPHHLWSSDRWLYLQPARNNSTIRASRPVCLPSHNSPFGIADVERPSPAATHLEKIGLTTPPSEIQSRTSIPSPARIPGPDARSFAPLPV